MMKRIIAFEIKEALEDHQKITEKAREAARGFFKVRQESIDANQKTNSLKSEQEKLEQRFKKIQDKRAAS